MFTRGHRRVADSIEVCRSDEDVDRWLGSEARHRGTSDVVYAIDGHIAYDGKKYTLLVLKAGLP